MGTTLTTAGPTTAGPTTAGPTTAGGALQRCVACGSEVFAAEYWARRPLLTRAAELSGEFADLLDAAAVDEIVSRRGLRTPFVRMARDGAVLPPRRYTRGGGAGATIEDQAADDKILAALGEGATLVLQALHRNWPPLVDFSAALSAELGHPVQINAYITPPQNRGFAAHYDVHDVFVLQVAGRKRWQLYEPVLVDPLPSQPWERRRDAVARRARTEEPLLDTLLEPGDALYLPRGTLHAASALGEVSIHLTVGVHPITRHQLVRHLLDLAQDEPALRASLPAGEDLGDPAVLAPRLKETIAALQAWLDRDGAEAGGARLAAVADQVAAGLRRDTRPAPLGPLAQLEAARRLAAPVEADAAPGAAPSAAPAAAPDSGAGAPDVGPGLLLRLRPGLRLRLTVRGEELQVDALDRTITLPPAADATLRVLRAGRTLAVCELPDLSAAQRREVAELLLRSGVAVPASR